MQLNRCKTKKKLNTNAYKMGGQQTADTLIGNACLLLIDQMKKGKHSRFNVNVNLCMGFYLFLRYQTVNYRYSIDPDTSHRTTISMRRLNCMANDGRV